MMSTIMMLKRQYVTKFLKSKHSKYSFSIEKKFQKEIVQFSSRSFSPFPDFAQDAQSSSLHSCGCVV